MSVHSWCRDVQRDEAVRAAEDNRQGPLPTLEEAIAAFSPSEEGLRTERVTLEIVRGDGLHVRQWPWHDILKAWGLGEEDEAESVRVVEECCLDRINMGEVIRQRDAAIRERDTLRAERITQSLTADRFASVVAEADRLRARVAELESQLESVACRAATAETENEKLRARVRDWERVHQAAHLMASLESAPAASGAAGTGWLTEEERGVLETVAYEAETSASKPRWEQVARVTRSILARSTPPEVVLPRYLQMQFYGQVNGDIRKALAAAGVAVKEVGRE